MRRYILTITGPSCSGKTTLLRALVATGDFEALISDTTRPQRENETPLEEYRFVSMDEFIECTSQDVYAQRVMFNGVCYGTRWDDLNAVFARGKCPVRIVEPSGVNQFRRIANHIGAEVISIFVDEDLETMVERWIDRIVAMSGSKFDTAYLAQRIIGTVLVESKWSEEAEYDFYYDLRYRQELELLHALRAVARGVLTPGQIRQIAPRVKDAA